MIFTSLEFFIFFPIVAVIFFLLPNRLRWGHLLFASYYFYMAWIPAYAGLMFFETLVVYAAGIAVEKSKSTGSRKFFLALGIVLNLSLLFVFKYLNFFEAELVRHGWAPLLSPTLNLVLPLGISFYTFHTISYLVDAYRGDVRTERHLGVLLLYIAYFPLLVAGPIARAAHLLPQLKKLLTNNELLATRFEYDRMVSGLRLMLLGFTKKLVLADNLAKIVQPVYAAPDEFSGASALIATIAFSFQIYFDFSAYTDIARGASRIFGIALTQNFRQPYFAIDIQDFWRRWHISLSTWFRDYLYIPLGGNRVSTLRWLSNLLIVFLLCGFWHGANWTFLAWGGLHGLYFYATYLIKRWSTKTINQSSEARSLEIDGFRICATFFMVTWAWVMFRAESIDQGLLIWRGIALIPMDILQYIYLLATEHVAFAPGSALGIKWILKFENKTTLMPIYVCTLTVIYFVFSYKWRDASENHCFEKWSTSARWLVYVGAGSLICLLGDFGQKQFIYFQF
jgi:alginate O-acetyltransferase complex protein AlgI